jgi:1-acyl-sn-glycerol-3-phosphate acyltransferase
MGQGAAQPDDRSGLGRGQLRSPPAAPPLPNRFAARAFGWYLDRLAGRHFTTVRWQTTEDPALWSGEALLFVANHTNWWDGFMAHQVTRALGLAFQILMDAKGVAAYPMFRRVGAVPVRRASPFQAVADLQTIAGNLRPGVGVWIFPQGERRPAAEPVVETERGAAQLALTAGMPVRLVPVGFRYPFLSEQLPEAFVLLGRSWVVPGGAGTRAGGRHELALEIEARLNRTLADLDEALLREDTADFDVLIRGRLSINKRLDRVRHSVGALEGPFEERNG